MYVPVSKKSLDIINYIEGDDIFNSKALYDMNKVTENLVTVTSCPERLDLIVNNDECYGFDFILNNIQDNAMIFVGRQLNLPTSNSISSYLSDLSVEM